MIYFKNDVRAERMSALESNLFETIWMKMGLVGFSILLCGCYWAPNSRVDLGICHNYGLKRRTFPPKRDD
mgnify:CR=1 FL=1